MKNLIIALIIVLLVAIGGYFVYQNMNSGNEGVPTDETPNENEPATTTEEVVDNTKTILGQSVEGRDIIAYHFGEGSDEVLFVGGIHGGYEWNTVSVAYELMDYLSASSTKIPSNVKVTVVPVLNPDGLNKVVGTEGRFNKANVPSTESATIPGRFNAHNVDLNRNFDCDWQANGTWQNKTVSGGTKAFSEPESQAIKNYIDSSNPKAVVVWYSAAGGVFASNCHNGILAETQTITDLYAKASGYPAYKQFNFYEITGDMVNWLAKEEIPAISVLLTNHTDTEWNKNQAGVDALLKHYAAN